MEMHYYQNKANVITSCIMCIDSIDKLGNYPPRHYALIIPFIENVFDVNN